MFVKEDQLHHFTAQFPKYSYEQWVEKANSVLKEKKITDYEQKIVENMLIKPLYTEDNLPNGLNQLHNTLNYYDQTWQIAQLAEGETIHEINKTLLQGIANGQNTISIKIPKYLNSTNLNELFNDLPVEKYPFFIEGNEEVIPFYLLLSQWLTDQKISTENISGFIGCDPIAITVSKGYSSEKADALYKLWRENILTLDPLFSSLRSVFARRKNLW